MSIRLSWPAKAYVDAVIADLRASTTPSLPPEPVQRDPEWDVLSGDNFWHLLALAKSSSVKFDLVYLDPPYNCGYEISSFSDKADNPLDWQWFERVLKVDGSTLGQEERWLTLLYARLLLIRELLSDSGTIAVSIDHCEFAPLRLLLNELFGMLELSRVFSRPHSFETTGILASSQPEYLIIITSAGSIPDLQLSDWPSTASARRRLSEELGVDTDGFTPKPIELLRYLVENFTGPTSLVLDPYAGSGAVARAVWDCNEIDNGRRRIVMVERDVNNVSMLLRRLADLRKRKYGGS